MSKIPIRFLLRDQIINKRSRSLLQKKEISVFSNDCLGGVICHDLHLQFNSPTVNMYMSAQDYIKFLTDMPKYLSQKMTYQGFDDKNVIIAGIGDVLLHLVHYTSYEEAYQKWEARKQRIACNANDIYIIMDDRNGCSTEIIQKYIELPYVNKVFLSHIPIENNCVKYIRGFEKKTAWISLLTIAEDFQ